MVARLRTSIGYKSASGNNGGFHSSYTRSAIKSSTAITTAILDIFDQFEDASDEILIEALQPTLELAAYYCPKDTHDLVNSRYVGSARGSKGPRVEIGFAKGGDPRYAGFVHEATWIPHAQPTRSKFLQAAVMEDLLNMANSNADNCRLLLIAGGINGNIIKIGRLPASPDQAMAIVDAPGQAPNPKWLLDYPALQILVRGTIDDYNGAHTQARKVKDLLLGIYSLNVGPDGDRWDSVVMRGDVNYIGPDENSRPVFSLNFGLIIEPAASADTNREALPL